jgi:hypothetical protein
MYRYCTCSTYRRSCPPLLDEEAAPEVKEEEELDESATEDNSVEQQDAVALGGESSEK